MKILLIGNLPEDKQESMLRFQTMMRRGLQSRGHEVLEVAPRLRLAKMAGTYRYSGYTKYLGYWDKFVLFPRELRRRIREEQPDSIHIVDHANAVYAKACPQRTLLSCHDLQQIRAARGEIAQQQVGRLGRQYQAWILRQIRCVRAVACVSASTAKDLTRVAGYPPAQITVIANALNDPFCLLKDEDAAATITRFLTERNQLITLPKAGFILNVGGAQWYKNRPGMLRIYSELRRSLPEAPLLILVGKALSAVDEALARSLGVLNFLIQLEEVPHPVLNALYCRSEGLLFPSFEEGFGWPLAEAQTCACPVFTSDRAPMNEIAGPHAVLFDPKDPVSAARKICEAWPERRVRAQAALPSSKRWESDTMLEAYERLYSQLATYKA